MPLQKAPVKLFKNGMIQIMENKGDFYKEGCCGKITSYNDYKNNVPIVKYEDVEKYIIDLINGKKNIFYKERP